MRAIPGLRCEGRQARVRADRVECGECGDGLPVERLTGLSELADALGEHTLACRVFA